MNKVFKIFIFVVVAGLAGLGAITTCTGLAIKEGIGHAIDQSMESGPQTVALTADGASIIKDLLSKQAIVLKGVQICLPKGQLSDENFSYSSSCLNGNCESTLEFKGPIPKSLALHREYQGQCVPQTIEDLPRYQVQTFSAQIKIDADLTQKLKVTDFENLKIEKTQNSQFLSNGFTRIGADTVVNLNYGTHPVSADEFLFGSKLVHIKYSNRPEPANPTMATTTTQQPQPVLASKVNSLPSNASVTFQVDGKTEQSLHLGDQYKFSITGAPPNSSFKGHCEGAAHCDNWFFFSMRSAKTDANGNLSWTGLLASNWNIPLTTYQFWVSFEGGEESNRASLTIGPYVQKAATVSAVTASKLQLTLDGTLDGVLEEGKAYVLNVSGGEPGQVLSPRCEGPMNPCVAIAFIMQARVTLDREGRQKMVLTSPRSSGIQPGKYSFWFLPFGGKPESNRISLTVMPAKTKRSN
jgi:hypothetical protein